MFIRIVSDLHLEFCTQPIGILIDNYIPICSTDDRTTLILAGDITPDHKQTVKVMDILSPRFAHIIYVAGNHEYYGSSIPKTITKLTNILNNYSNVEHRINEIGQCDIGSTTFIFGTLWGTCNGPTSYCHDFKYIKDLTLNQVKEFNKTQVMLMDVMISKAQPGRTVIVVSHHIPMGELVEPRFMNSDNSTFVAKAKFNPKVKYWIYGHTHTSNSVVIDQTNYICNAGGYPNEATGYNPRLIIEV